MSTEARGVGPALGSHRPEMCSGLPVVRYAPDDLAREFEHLIPGALEKIESRRHMHVTPKGNRQSFQYSVFRKVTHDE